MTVVGYKEILVDRTRNALIFCLECSTFKPYNDVFFKGQMGFSRVDYWHVACVLFIPSLHFGHIVQVVKI